MILLNVRTKKNLKEHSSDIESYKLSEINFHRNPMRAAFN
ncbi:CLUMA_CG019005, isoform A, partial [Clunio marinus]